MGYLDFAPEPPAPTATPVKVTESVNLNCTSNNDARDLSSKLTIFQIFMHIFQFNFRTICSKPNWVFNSFRFERNKSNKTFSSFFFRNMFLNFTLVFFCFCIFVLDRVSTIWHLQYKAERQSTLWRSFIYSAFISAFYSLRKKCRRRSKKKKEIK